LRCLLETKDVVDLVVLAEEAPAAEVEDAADLAAVIVVAEVVIAAAVAEIVETEVAMVVVLKSKNKDHF
jgi:hypothetical protein